MTLAPDPQDYIREDTVFITATGSRLYGLENEHSDYDFIVVSAGKRISTAKISGELDMRRVDFETFATGLRDKPGGIYMEALYSQEKIYGPLADRYMDFLDGFTPALGPLRSSMMKMATAVLHEDLLKRVRFAAYLASRWNQWYWSGQQRYNPRLTAPEREAVEQLGQLLLPLGYEERRRILKDELFFLEEKRARELFALELSG